MQGIESVLGPLSTTIDGCARFFEAVLGNEPWRYDPTTVYAPFRPDEYALKHIPGKLCFGVLRTDRVFTPVPPINRALDMAVEAVRRAGHEVIEWEPASHPAINELAGKIFYADGGADYDEITKSTGEPRFGGAMVGSAEDSLSAWEVRRVLCARGPDARSSGKRVVSATNSASATCATGRRPSRAPRPGGPWTASSRRLAQRPPSLMTTSCVSGV